MSVLIKHVKFVKLTDKPIIHVLDRRSATKNSQKAKNNLDFLEIFKTPLNFSVFKTKLGKSPFHI